MSARAQSSSTQWLVGVGWVILCVVGSYVAMRYDFVPGRLGPKRLGWPVETALERRSGATTVVAFLHPRCVCTRATVKQLVRTLTAHPGASLIAAAFVPPSTDGVQDRTAWESNDYVKTIQAAIPTAQIFFDAGGAEALRFGAYTSGTILIYDPQGREVFRGGITDRRGGERDNPGVRALGAALTTEAGTSPTAGSPTGVPEGAAGGPSEARVTSLASTPVFGCPLVTVGTRKQEGKNTW